MITARQLQKLAKQGQPFFLAIIRPADGVPRTRRKKGGNSKSPIYAVAAHGMTEGQKRKISRKQAQRRIGLLWLKENNKFSTVSLKATGRIWKPSSISFVIYFQKSYPKVYPQIERYNIRLGLNQVANLPIGHLTDWVLRNRMS